MRLVVFGWGNEARGDDGLGPLLLARIAAAFQPSSALLYAAAFAWVLAFGGFAAIFGPLLLGRPPNWAGRSDRRR